jgi:hypothetical protein
MVRSIHAFPWDAAVEGSSAMIDALGALGCNTLLLSVNYHRARLFRPRQPGLGYYSRPIDWMDFEPEHALYAAGFPLPPLNPDGFVVSAVQECRDHCKRSGLAFTAGVTGCHNTTIGLARPDYTVRNAFGNCYAFALCPGHPEVRAYLLGLVRDVCRNLAPEAILLDSFSFLNAVHREHHELMFVPPGVAGEHLLALCLCEHCRAHADRNGVDPEAIQATVRRLVEAALRHEGHVGNPGFDEAELAALLMEEPELYAFEQVRQQIVRSLMLEAAEIAREYGCEVDMNSGLLARPSARGWTEGGTLRDRAEACRHVYVQAHFRQTGQSHQDLAWAATVLPPERLVLATMMSDDFVNSANELRARVEYATGLGAAGVSLYNYGLLTSRRLGWIRDAFGATTDSPERGRN